MSALPLLDWLPVLLASCLLAVSSLYPLLCTPVPVSARFPAINPKRLFLR